MVDQPLLPLKYGVDYSKLDPFKLIAQKAADTTNSNAERLGHKFMPESRGESAAVFEEEDRYSVKVIEGLGTKNAIADLLKMADGSEHYRAIARCLLATAVNDGVSLGADIYFVALVINAGGNEWFTDLERAQEFCSGIAEVCNEIGATWGGGESQTLTEVVFPKSSVHNIAVEGEIKPKSNYTLLRKIEPGDQIVILPSNGIQTNYLTACRDLIPRLPKGLSTMVEFDGRTYGEALLSPSYIYQVVVRDLNHNNLAPVYMSHLTGHGLIKVMRSTAEVGYVIEDLPEIDRNPDQGVAIFKFIKDWGQLSNEEAYSKMNMGCGFALIVRKEKLAETLKICTKHFPRSWHAGYVTNGPKRVELKSIGVTFFEDALQIR
ncbi:MAG TPA: AIR synthase related protein [Candidatus Saccharimonadales bacterium]|nr:AIR synthase related protein [Candidatus Saccharimonadales bacterium]